jgi:hypothetical protein
MSRCKVHRIVLLFCLTLRCSLDAIGSKVWSGATQQQQQQSAAVVWEQLSKPGKGAISVRNCKPLWQPPRWAFCLDSAGAGAGAGGWRGSSSNSSVVEQHADTVVRPVRASVLCADLAPGSVFEAFPFSQQQQTGAGALLAMVVACWNSLPQHAWLLSLSACAFLAAH